MQFEDATARARNQGAEVVITSPEGVVEADECFGGRAPRDGKG
jgi:hypothetical protein